MQRWRQGHCTAEEARAKKRARLADATISDQQAVEKKAIAEVLALVENAEREVAIAERKVAIAIEIVQLVVSSDDADNNDDL